MSRGRGVSRIVQALGDLDRRWSARLCISELPATPREARPWQWPLVLCARLADGPLWIVIGAAAMLWGTDALRKVVVWTAAGVVLTAVVVATIKFSIRRERPRGAVSALWSTMPRYDRYSFPSGHAARAACIAVMAVSVNGRLTVPAVFMVLAVASARVMMGIHYLLDVVCGIALGSGGGWLVLLLWG